MELEAGFLKGIYVYGSTGIIAMQDKNESYYYMIKDHLRSISVAFDENNGTSTYYSYTAWGEVLDSEVTIDIPYQYTGQEMDSETGLNNYRARLYDAALKRFYSVDPMLEFASPYCYVGNNPLNFVDPTGEISEWAKALIDILASLGMGHLTTLGFSIVVTYPYLGTALLILAPFAAGFLMGCGIMHAANAFGANWSRIPLF